MKAETLTLDRGFRPSFKELITPSSPADDFLTAWQINSTGQPTLSQPHLRAAVWHGERFSEEDETPVIVAAIERSTKHANPLLHAAYYFGIAVKDQVEGSPDPTEAYAQFAVHPCIKNSDEDSNFHFMLYAIRQIIPPPN